MILYVENPKGSTKKNLLELIKKFNYVTAYRINIQKSVVFLYTNNELSDKEIKKTIPYTMASKTRKYLGINYTKEVKDLYTEHHKTLMKVIKEDTSKWKEIPCSWIRRILLKCSYYLKPSIDSMQFPSKFH